MGKWAYAIMRTLKFASENPEGFGMFIGWLIGAAIATIIVSLIVAGVARLFGKDFEDWFSKTALVWGGIEIISGIIFLVS